MRPTKLRTKNGLYLTLLGWRKEVHKVEGYLTCTATHPDNPNWSGNSRGRKLHLVADKEYTLCKQLVDEYMPAEHIEWTVNSNGTCKNCLKLAEV